MASEPYAERSPAKRSAPDSMRKYASAAPKTSSAVPLIFLTEKLPFSGLLMMASPCRNVFHQPSVASARRPRLGDSADTSNLPVNGGWQQADTSSCAGSPAELPLEIR